MNDLQRIQRLHDIEQATRDYSQALQSYSVGTVRNDGRILEDAPRRHELLMKVRTLQFLLRMAVKAGIHDADEEIEELTFGCEHWMSHADELPLPQFDTKRFRRQLTGCKLLINASRRVRLSIDGGANTAIPKDLISQKDAAAIAGVHESMVSRRVTEGVLTGFGKNNIVSKSELESNIPLQKRKHQFHKEISKKILH